MHFPQDRFFKFMLTILVISGNLCGQQNMQFFREAKYLRVSIASSM